MIESGALDVTIVIPAFNEALRLPKTLTALNEWIAGRSEKIEVIVVDDGSTDSTAEIHRDYPSIYFESLSENSGKGAAVRRGMHLAAGELILMMDADLATPMSEFDRLADVIKGGADVVIGSRPLRSSTLAVRQPVLREYAGRVFNFIVQLVSGLAFKDTQCGFKLWRSRAAKECFGLCRVDGFAFDVEALVVAKALGYTIVEVGVKWAHQPGAAAFTSATSYVRHACRMIIDTIAIRWNHKATSRV
jgi:dolichyl-phosphate beta-glucosyltransferase